MPELHFRGLLLGFRGFLFERRKGKCFVELARLIILFRVGLGKLAFVVFGLSRFPVGLSPFFVFCFLLERWWQIGDGFVGLARLNFFVSRWACETFVSEFRFRCLLLGFRSFFA